MARGGSIKGGDKLAAALNSYARKAQAAGKLKVGFLEGATYPNGVSVAYIAALQEFGVTWTTTEREQTIYRSIDLATGEFKHGGAFRKAAKANYATTHKVGPHQITIPPRPFFRTAIAQNDKRWGEMFAALMQRNNMDVKLSLSAMGEVIKGDIQKSITELVSPPLRSSTIRRKGSSKPLVETGHLLMSVAWEYRA